mmetsp:Transcript_65624/g.137166  ORF Transcript_65624/g.137166 Transcript_65624/m.137166 type:complete len:364 (-) Transcript_65624:246-1337(-)
MLSSASSMAMAPVALSSATLGCISTLAFVGLPWQRPAPTVPPTDLGNCESSTVELVQASDADPTAALPETLTTTTADADADEDVSESISASAPSPSLEEILNINWAAQFEKMLLERDSHDVREMLVQLVHWGEENVLQKLSESWVGRLHLLASLFLVDLLVSVFFLRGACRLMQTFLGRCCRSCRCRRSPQQVPSAASHAHSRTNRDIVDDSDSDSEDPAARSKASASTHEGDAASKAPSEESESSLNKGPKAAKRTARELAEVLRQRREGCEEIESVPRDSRAAFFAEEKKDFGKGLPCFREDQDLIREAEAAAHLESRRQSGRSRARTEQEVRLWMSQRRTECAESEGQGRRVVGPVEGHL